MLKPKKGETKEVFLARAAVDAEAIAVTDATARDVLLAQWWNDGQGKQRSSLSLQPQKHEGQFTITELVTRADAAADLPPGCCARMTGVALVYGVIDDYGTIFAPGCLAKTVAEKVRTGKVRLFADHEPKTRTHVGTVTDIKDVGDTAVMTAVIFDTEAGRAMKEYLEAVTKSGAVTGAVTGLSVGFRSRDDETMTLDTDDGPQWACQFNEIELREVSVTPVNAVPGSDVLAVRKEAGETNEGLLKRILARILGEVPESEARAVFEAAYASAADQSDMGAPAHAGATPAAAVPNAATESESSTASAAPAVVPFEERMKIMREIMGSAAAASS